MICINIVLFALNMASGKFYGDKYDELIAGASQIEAAGALNVPAHPFSQRMIDSILTSNGLPTVNEAHGLTDGDLAHVYEQATGLELPDNSIEALTVSAKALAEYFSGPVLLRSSGHGDAPGIGVYDSTFHGTDAESIRNASRVVIASYFSEKAINYRRRAELPPGFAMFMQPVVGNLVKARDRWSDQRFETEAADPIFAPRFSGNVRIGTPRHPNGVVRLQPGFGSAVNSSILPSFSLDRGYFQDFDAMHVLVESLITGRDYDSLEEIQGYFMQVNGEWNLIDETSYRPRFHYEGLLTIGGIRRVATAMYEYASLPQYFEFAVAEKDGQERLHVVQKSDLKAGGTQKILGAAEFINQDQIVVDDIRIEAGESETAPFSSIVCLSSTNHGDLYEFDKSDQAQNGYMLVYHASRTPQSNRINVRKLKNLRALVDIESMSASHSLYGPENHLIGYSDQLNIPLLSVYDSSGATWRRLNGTSWGREEQLRTESVSIGDSLLVRQGVFKVLIDPKTKRAMVVDLRTA